MDCRGVERRLEAWLAGRLPADEASAVDDHLVGCEPCRRLVALAEAAATATASGEAVPAQDELTAAVLRSTSGPTCAAAEERLPAWFEGDLDPAGASLLAGHVERCARCAALAGILRGLSEDLAAMAAVEPPADLVERVLARTLRRPEAGRVDRVRRWAPHWRRWLARPRFALEAAYAATAAAALVFSLSVRSLEAAPVEAADLLRRPVAGLEAVAASAPAAALDAARTRADDTVAQTRTAMLRAGDGLRTFWGEVASLLQSPGEEIPAADEEEDEETP